MNYDVRTIHNQSKEINIVFSQEQNQTDISKTQKIPYDRYSNKGNLSYEDIEINFYKENIGLLQNQIDYMNKMLLFKCKIIDSNKNNNLSEYDSLKELYENKVKEIKTKYLNEENELNSILKTMNEIKKENDDYEIRKYQLRKDKCQLESLLLKLKPKPSMIPSTTKNISKIKSNENNEIDTIYENNVAMTTTGNEMCRSRLGNKMLMSLDIGEINRNQNFLKKNLAYPVLKKKKIVFNIEGKENSKGNSKPMNVTKGLSIATNSNTKTMGKKKISLDNFNNYGNNDFVSKTVY